MKLTQDTFLSPVAEITPVAFPAEGPSLGHLTQRDRHLFFKFGWGAQTRPRFPTIAAAIQHQIKAQPDAIAAEYDGCKITYGALGEASDRLASAMQTAGVTPGDVVCLYLHRSLEMIVGIVAAMKVGAAYVPQHVGVAPNKTLVHIAKATKASVILTREAVADKVPAFPNVRTLTIDDYMVPDRPMRVTPAPVAPSDVAMILFTSGTTGVPNGVQVTHKNLANILLTAPGDLGMAPGRRVGQILSIAFDMAAWETLGALANGATLVIRGKSIQDTAERVDTLIATPSILASLDAKRCRGVRAVAVAGEPCPRCVADEWSWFAEFYNSCGPTETTIINTAAQHHPQKPDLSIGKPTPNNTVYVLDETLRALPIGEVGEMWAGGDCVTAGYLSNPDLNRERYRPDPFRAGHMMFRTRDLGAWTETGELLHHGRVDDLVKIRGFRVELDGVSAALEATPGCRRAVTLKLDDRNLVGFVSPAAVTSDAAIAEVDRRLPYYCKPTVVMSMEALPKTPRGKIDKRGLMDQVQQHIADHQIELN